MIKHLEFDENTLLKLLGLKLLMLLLSALVLGFTYYTLQLDLDYPKILLSMLLGVVVLSVWFARSRIAIAVGEIEIFLLLSSDIILLSLLINYSGGSANPFASSLLVPLALSAALLSKRASLTTVVITLMIYAWWTFGGSTMDHVNHAMFSLHLYGMWVNFLLCAIILFIFMTSATESIRRQDHSLQKAREKILRDEQLVAIATLTANTAHALGTPMSTMSIIAGEWERDNNMDPEKKLLCEQLDLCKTYLARIGEAVQYRQDEISASNSVNSFYNELRNQVLLLRPEANIRFNFHQNLAAARFRYNRSLLFAMVNLIENAVQSGSQHTRVLFEKSSEDLHIIIKDSGEGLHPATKKKLGTTFIPSNKGGWGLGVYLSNSTVEQFAGKITMTDRRTGGTTTTVSLPLAS